MATLVGCRSEAPPDPPPSARACDAEPEVLTTAEGVAFVRTPDACFAGLPDWPYAPQYVELDGLRQAYVDAGPSDGPVVLLLHGQPSWSYLYRKMIPVLADAGYRVIAMDHLGMGRSDKPVDIADYSYLGHYDRLLAFIEALALEDINLFVQDWGSLIGLRVAGLNPDRFARIAVGDGTLPVIPAGVQPYPAVEDPDAVEDLASPFANFSAQQEVYFDGCERPDGDDFGFGVWMQYAMKGASFQPSQVVEALTWFDLPSEEEAAYDAPFPSRVYLAGARVFPSLVNELPGVNDEAMAGLRAFERPFLTVWASNDPGSLGRCETQQQLVQSVPGAWGQPHTRLDEASHFLQDDQGEAIAERLVPFFASEPLPPPVPFGRGSRYCEVLLVRMNGGGLQAEVWGTPGLSDCPVEGFATLDADTIRAETGAFAVVINGPRYWLVDAASSEIPLPDRMMFGALWMRKLATVDVETNPNAAPYEEAVVLRSTMYRFDAGSEIYRLTAPGGTEYVMQSMSQMEDPDQELAGLPTLGDRLALPQGWTYEAVTLEAELVMSTEGEAIVLQDDLLNTYQRVGSSTTTPTGLPILDDGTGTPCTDDADCVGLVASHCLVTGNGGFCTVQGCAAGACGAPYVCCYECSEQFASFLPFDPSACIPEPATSQLTQMAGCTCE
ncbi:MAG: haloalkane dehalogenase [Deltaproteobacteria bacterium]